MEKYFKRDEGEEAEIVDFDWKATKTTLNNLSDDNEKLAHLIDQMALYEQEIIANDLPSNGYYEKCKSEKDRIERQQELRKLQVSYGGKLYSLLN